MTNYFKHNFWKLMGDRYTFTELNILLLVMHMWIWIMLNVKNPTSCMLQLKNTVFLHPQVSLGTLKSQFKCKHIKEAFPVYLTWK